MSREFFEKRLRLAVKESTFHVQDEAQSHHDYVDRTGALTRAIDTRFNQGGMEGIVFLDTNHAPYGLFIHRGAKPHTIKPRNRMALRWAKGGAFHFAKVVHHPGIKARPFIYDALERSREEINAIFSRQLDKALDEVANEFSRKNYTVKI